MVEDLIFYSFVFLILFFINNKFCKNEEYYLNLCKKKSFLFINGKTLTISYNLCKKIIYLGYIVSIAFVVIAMVIA